MEDAAFQKIKDNLQCFNRPIYEVIIETIYSMIESGELPAGTRFPPDKKLALELGINHITLAKALNELRRRNVLERRRASGTSVPPQPASRQNIVTARNRRIEVLLFSFHPIRRSVPFATGRPIAPAKVPLMPW